MRHDSFMALTRIPRASASAVPLTAAILLLSAAALFAGQYGLLPPVAYADDHLLTVQIAAEVPSPTDLQTVPFNLTFSRHINSSTLDTSDIRVSSGTVQDLRLELDGASFGSEGSGTGQFNNPTGVAVNGTGHIFVADNTNHRVSVYDSDLNSLPDIDHTFRFPYGVAVNGTGHVFVADFTSKVIVFDRALDHVADIQQGFGQPLGLAVNGTGHLFVADKKIGGSRVAVFDSARTYLGDITHASLANPWDVAVDRTTGNIYVADHEGAGHVVVFDPSWNRIADIPSLDFPNGIEVDPASGNVFVAEHTGNGDGDDRLRVFNGTTYRNIATVTTTFGNYTGIAMEGTTGTVYVAEKARHRVQAFNQTYAFNVAGPTDMATLTVSVPPGRVQDADGNYNVASNLAGIEIGGEAPVPVITSEQTGPTNVTPISFNVTFDLDVAGFAGADITLSGAAAPTAVTGFTVLDAKRYSFDVVPTGPGNVTVDIAADVAQSTPGGVDNAAADRFTVVYDNAAPTPEITGEQTLSHGIPTLNFTAAWGENVTGFETDDIALAGLATGGVLNLNVAPGTDDKNYTFGVVPTEDGTLTVDIAAGRVRDIAGNDNEAAPRFSIEYDSSAPGTAVSAVQPDPTNAATITFHVNFTVPVAGFTSGDIALTGDAASAGVTGFAPGDATGANYTFDVVPAEDGTITVDIAAGVAQSTANGLDNTAAPRFSIESDRTVPGVEIRSLQSGPTNASPINFRVEFTENVTGFASSEIVLSGITATTGGGVTNFAGPDGFANYTFDVVPAGDGTLHVDIGAGVARDNATSPNTAAARFSIVYDGTGPVPVIAPVQAGPTGLNPVPFNMTFSEHVNATVLEASDITATSGTVLDLRPSPSHNATVGTTGATGTANGAFNTPSGIAADSAGNIYVADRDNDRVQVFDHAGAHIANIGSLDAPYGVAVDATSGTIYVADTNTHTIRVYDSARISTGTTITDGFSQPTAVAVDATSGTVYVADFGNSRLRAYDQAGTRIGEITGLTQPRGVAVDGSGNIYVAVTGSDIVKVYGPGMTHITDITGLSQPSGVAVDPVTGNIYVADTGNDRIAVFDPSLASIANVTGSFAGPYGVAVHGTAGHLYVADAGAHDIRIFDPAYAFDVADPADGRILNVSLPAGRVQDRAGNDNVASNLAGIEIDREAPVPVITATQTSPTNAATINFQVTFSEDVTGFAGADITLSGDAASNGVANFDDSNAPVYSFNVVPSTNGTVTVDVAAGVAQSLTGVDNAAAVAPLSIEYDGIRPGVTVKSVQAGPATAASPINLRVEFTENVTGFVSSEIVLSGITTTGGVTNFAGPDGFANYTFDVVPAGDGALHVDVAAGVARDNATNPNTAAARFSITYDRTPQSTTITSTQTNPTNETPINFEVDFVNAVNGFDSSDITLSGDAAPSATTGFAGADGAASYTFDVIPAGDGNVTVGIAANAGTYVSGGDPTGEATYTIRYDGTAPGPTVNSTQHPGPTNSATVLFTVNFTEPVNGFAAGGITAAGVGDVTLTGGGIQNFNEYNSSSYTFELTPTGMGNVTVDVPAGGARDDAGNDNTAAPRYTIGYDDRAPYTRITSAQGPGPTGSPVIGFEVGFGEEVREFTAADITLSGATTTGGVTGFTAAGINYTFEVLPAADGTVMVDIGAGVAQDTAGNDNTAAPRYSIEYDSSLFSPVTAAAVTGPHEITVSYARAATAAADAYGTLRIDGTARAYAADPLADGTTDTHVLTFTGPPAAADATGTVTIDQTAVTDTSLGTAIGTDEAAVQRLADGQAPRVDSAAITAPNRFTVWYTEPVYATGATAAYGTGPTIDGTSRGYAAGDPISGNGTAAHLLEFTGAGAAPDDTGTVSLDHTRITDAAGNVMGTDTAVPQALEGGGQLSVRLTTMAPQRTGLDPVPFSLDFSRVISTATLNGTKDISMTSGTVSNLRPVLSSDGSATGGFSQLHGVAVDQDRGRVYMTDAYNHRTVVFDTELRQIDTIGHGHNTFPWDVAVNGTGHLFVALAGAAGNRLAIYDAELQFVANINGIRPGGVGVAADGTIYTTGYQDSTLRVFNPTLDAKIIPPSTTASTVSGLSVPRGIAVDDAVTGNIYVAERNHNRIAVFNSSLDRIDTIVGHPGNSLASPTGVDTDGMGNIYVVDKNNAQIEIYNSERVHMATVENSFDVPYDIAVDSAGGHIYVAESGNSNRVQAFNVSSYLFGVAGADDQDTLRVSLPAGTVLDPAGNENLASDTVERIIDRIIPVPVINSTQDPGPTNASTINFEVNFNKDVSGFAGTDITLSGDAVPSGGLTGFREVSGSSYTFDVAPSVDGHIHVDIATGVARDATNNANVQAARYSIESDRSPPEPTLASAQHPGPTNATTISYTVRFENGPVDDFTATDITLTGAAAPAAVTGFAGSGADYTFDVVPTTNGTVTVGIAAGVAHDGAGNPSTTAAGLSIRHDSEIPEPVITSTPSGKTGASTILFDVGFGEPVDDFTESDIELSGAATAGGVTGLVPAGPHNYTFSVTTSADGDILVDIAAGAARDKAGNPSTAAARYSVTYNSSLQSIDITSPQHPGPTNATTVSFTVGFGSPINGFTAADIDLSDSTAPNGGVANFVGADGAATYTFDVIPTGDGTITVDIAPNAAAYVGGGTTEAAAKYSIVYDGSPPEPAITSAQTVTATINFNVTFAESVEGFDLADIEVSGTPVPDGDGSVGNFAGGDGDLVYTFDVVPTAGDGTVRVDIRAGAARDDAGNPSTAAGLSTTYDGLPLVKSAKITGPNQMTITYTEPVIVNVTDSAYHDNFKLTGQNEWRGFRMLAGPSLVPGPLMLTGNGTAVHTLGFNGTAATTAATAAITLDQTAITETLYPHKSLGDDTAYEQPVKDGQVPRIDSARITGPNEVTIRYTEPVNATGSAYGILSVNSTAAQYAPAPLGGNGTKIHTLDFTGVPAATGATGRITINQTAVTDPASNALGSDTAAVLTLTDGQPPRLTGAALNLKAGDNGRLTLIFDEAVSLPPPTGTVTVTSTVSAPFPTVTLSGGDYAVFHVPGAPGTLALDISGAKKIMLNNQAYASAKVDLSAGFVSDPAGNAYEEPAATDPLRPISPSPVQDNDPPKLGPATLDLSPDEPYNRNNNVFPGHLILTFDGAVNPPQIQPATDIVIHGANGASSTLSGNGLSLASGQTGDKTFVLHITESARLAFLGDSNYTDLSTRITLPSGFVSNGLASYTSADQIPLAVTGHELPPVPPSFVRAVITGNSSVLVTYDEPVRHSVTHYTNMALYRGDDPPVEVGQATDTASFGNSVLVSWSTLSNVIPGSSIGFNITGDVADIFGNNKPTTTRHTIPYNASVPDLVAGVDAPRVDIPIVGDTRIGNITAADKTPVIWLDPDRTAAEGNATLPSHPLTVSTDRATVTFPPGATVTGLSESKTVIIGASAKAPSAVFQHNNRNHDYSTATVVEFGHPSQDLDFGEPVKVIFHHNLNGTVVFSIDSAGDTLLVPVCGGLTADSTSADAATALAAPIASGEDDNACRVQGTGIVWTEHFSAIGSAVRTDLPIPTITATQPSPTSATTINFRVAFTDPVTGLADPVTGFEADDITLSGAPTGGVTSFAGSGAAYTFNVSPTADGTIHVDIAAGAARDAANNGDTAAAARFSIVYRAAQSTGLVDPATTSGGRSSGGGGGGGGGGGAGGGGGPAIGPATQAQDIHIRSISWDCQAGTVGIVAGPGPDDISVSVRTTQLGYQQAVRAGDAATAPAAVDMPGYGTFTSAMATTDGYIGVTAILQSGRALSTTSESVSVDSCVGQKLYDVPFTAQRPGSAAPLQDGAGAPDPAEQGDAPRTEPQQAPAVPQQAPAVPPADLERTDPADDATPPSPPSPPQQQPPETNGDGCGPGTVSRDGVCVVVVPDVDPGTGGDGVDDGTGTGGGCLIATAAYGTELAPQVQQLRELRDATVLSTVSGASFMGAFNTAYYTVSPAVADLERQHPAFRDLTRAAITPGIWVLGAVMQSAEPGSEESVAAAGVLSIVLLAGMYAGPPALGTYVAARRLRHRPHSHAGPAPA